MGKRIINKTIFKLYNAGWSLAIPFLKKNQRIAEGFQQRLEISNHCVNADIWIQAASGGEAYLALELLAKMQFKKKMKILLTSNTSQGIEILERAGEYTNGKNIDVHISFSPFDKPAIMADAVKKINPKVMVLIELELWPGLLQALKKHQCKTIIVNGRLTQKSLNGYMKWPSIWHEIAPSKVLAISGEDAKRFGQLFPDTDIEVMNNIKFDRFAPRQTINEKSQKNPLLALLNPKKKIVILGSVRAEEEDDVGRIIAYLQEKSPETIIWLFPRHMHRTGHWCQVLDTLKLSWCLRSETDKRDKDYNIILWDKFGELGFAYELADAAFVGGSLAPLGGQNFLEVLASGLIPVTGPSWGNFIWTGEEILEKGLLCLEKDWLNVAKKLVLQLKTGQTPEIVKKKMSAYLISHQGGTEFACKQIEKIIALKEQQ